jgi:ubiquinone/menaquinone biosynthesis C-methylase UbiE
MKAYFNFAYNPVYDFTVGRLDYYRRLQEKSIGKLELEENDKVLCVGLGTGNEILRILEVNRDVRIIGIDYSPSALVKAQQKASAHNKEMQTFFMDARNLEFPQEEFDKVLCIHVMDFIPENEKVVSEIVRVLKTGGKFVITFPSRKEGVSLAGSLLDDYLSNSTGISKYRIVAILKSLPRILVGFVYLPLLCRSNKKSYSRDDLEDMITRTGRVDLQIEEAPVYQDFIVFGSKKK